MPAIIIDGKVVATRIKESLIHEVEQLKSRGRAPGLAVVLVGNNEASKIYVNMKKKACAEVGIASYEYVLPQVASESQLLELVDQLNNDPVVSGILVQLPLPRHIDEEKVICAISVEKDVDAFHPVNVGRIMTGNALFEPCTPSGVMELIKESGISVEGKECVVLGRSNIVGKPQAMLLLAANGTVTICHSKTINLSEVCKRADILVVAIGKPGFVTADMVKPGAVVIDVGINRPEGGKMVGDVDYASVSEVAGAITPVPGGVGPMTIAMLMKNTVKAAKIQLQI